MYSMLQNEICHLNIFAIHVDAIVANIGLLINKHLIQTILMPFLNGSINLVYLNNYSKYWFDK